MGDSKLAILQRLLAAGAARDWDVVTSCVSADFVITEPEALPYGGQHHGPDGFRRMIELFQDAWEKPQFEISVMGEIGATVVMKGVLKAHSTATGQYIESGVAEFFTVDDGVIVASEVFYFDLPAVVAAVTP